MNEPTIAEVPARSPICRFCGKRYESCNCPEFKEATGDISVSGTCYIATSGGVLSVTEVLEENRILKDKLEEAWAALGLRMPEDGDLNAEIFRIRDEGRAYFHDVTRLSQLIADLRADITELRAHLNPKL